jgi:hypothetical protein
MCYPRIETFRAEKIGAAYNFVLEGVHPDLLPILAEKAGDQAKLHTKQAGAGFDVTITSIPREHASDLLKRLRPGDPNIVLPD